MFRLVRFLFLLCAAVIVALTRRCSVPLCYVYPAMLHYRACARTRRQKAADIAMIVFGLLAAAYTTTQTVRVRVPHFHRPGSPPLTTFL